MVPEPIPIETSRDRDQWKSIIYFLGRWLYRTWMVCVLLLTVLVALLALEEINVISRDTTAVIWVGIIAVGVAFLALLFPVFVLSHE